MKFSNKACLSVALFSLGTQACHRNTSESDILIKGGTPAQANVLRSTVQIIFAFKKFSNAFACTGTLVDEKGVLTAQHCYRAAKDGDSNEVIEPDDISILFIDSAGKRVGEPCPVTNVYKAPGYVANSSATMEQSSRDALYLSHDCQIPSGFGPAPILPPDQIEEGDVLIAAGYGKTNDDINSPSSNRLLQISMALKSGNMKVSDGSTKMIKAIDQFVDPSGNPFGFLRALAVVPGTATCQGDSGGPFYKLVDGVPHLAGVYTSSDRSQNSACSESGLGFATLAANHLPWIESNLGRKLSTRPGNTGKGTNTSTSAKKEMETKSTSGVTLPEMEAQKPEVQEKMTEAQENEAPKKSIELPESEMPKKSIELPEISKKNAELPETVKPKKNIEIRQHDWKKILESVKKVKPPKLDIEGENSKPAKRAPKAKTSNGLSFGKQPSFCSTTFPSATGEVQSAFLTQAAQILKPAQRGRCRAESQNGVQSFAEEIKGEIGEEGKMECLKIYCDARTN